MIIYSDNGTGDYSKVLNQYSTYVNITNDADTPLTIIVGDVSVTVLGMEQFEGSFAPFKSIAISAQGAWRFVLEGIKPSKNCCSYTVADVLQEVRPRISDIDAITYQDDELISYLNTVIDFLNGYLIAKKQPEMVKQLTIADCMRVPCDWDSFAGQYPVYITQGKFQLYDIKKIKARYFALRPHVATVADIVPFSVRYKSVLIQGTAMRALNRNEYDISQDKTLLAELLEVTGR